MILDGVIHGTIQKCRVQNLCLGGAVPLLSQLHSFHWQLYQERGGQRQFWKVWHPSGILPGSVPEHGARAPSWLCLPTKPQPHLPEPLPFVRKGNFA